MTGHHPVFIDQFGTGGGSSGDEGPNRQINVQPEWRLAWQGQVPLWKAFWVYFVMGHGVILGLGCGAFVFSLLAGFFVDPSSSKSGAMGFVVAGTIMILVFLVFAIWAVIAVWRCADNCMIKIRGIYVRILMVGYVIALMFPVVDYVID